MKYLIVDALLNGSGIRDKYEGGYLDPEKLDLNHDTINLLTAWLSKYENERYNGFVNNVIVNELDREGKNIAILIKRELVDVKIEYFSDARMISEIVSD